MKRSEINGAVLYARSVLEKNLCRLPTFGYWDLGEWRKNADRLENLKAVMLGWDVTDFGFGCFEKIGSVLFTIRNGSITDKSLGTPYAEKYIIMRDRPSQVLPMHYHYKKTEDIINRGGGVLCMQLYASMADDSLDMESPVELMMDGIRHTFKAGEIIEVEPGCSATLTPGIYHSFWAKEGAGDLVIGEVSSINDDNADNRFLDDSKRFSEIVEDEEPICPLCSEYGALL